MIKTVADLVERLQQEDPDKELRLLTYNTDAEEDVWWNIEDIEIRQDRVYLRSQSGYILDPLELAPTRETLKRIRQETNEKRFAEIDAVIPGMATVDYSEVKD